MKTALLFSMATAALLWSSCMVAVNDPDTRPSDPPHPPRQAFTQTTVACFPFQDNSNWWRYTEEGGNGVSILVTDTISDDNIMYYRVSFRENRVDTTNDWFRQTNAGIFFSESLIGNYRLFLPAKIDSAAGSFASGGLTVRYTYYDSLPINGIQFRRVLKALYNMPLLHGFDEITFADSIGIVRLIDHTGRWPITYMIDSCGVSGILRRFR